MRSNLSHGQKNCPFVCFSLSYQVPGHDPAPGERHPSHGRHLHRPRHVGQHPGGGAGGLAVDAGRVGTDTHTESAHTGQDFFWDSLVHLSFVT